MASRTLSYGSNFHRLEPNTTTYLACFKCAAPSRVFLIGCSLRPPGQNLQGHSRTTGVLSALSTAAVAQTPQRRCARPTRRDVCPVQFGFGAAATAPPWPSSSQRSAPSSTAAATAATATTVQVVMDTVTEEARGAAVTAGPADRDGRSAATDAAPSASDGPPPSSGDASQPSVSCRPRESAAGETAATATAMAAAAAAATELAALTIKQAGTDQSESGAREPDGSKAKPKPKQKSNPRWAKMEDADGLDELLEGVYDNEDELVAKLMQQLQGLSHKQQRLYGIWDGTTDGGRRAFVEQWRRRHAERRAMVAGMHDPATPPTERMALRTSYILRWRKVLFSCPGCWLLPGLCVCGRMQRFAPQRTRIVVHAHHGEWGSASNSGSILPTSLEGSEILLYGHPDHDARMREILNDPSRTTALLWPGSDSLLPEQLSSIAAERTGGRLTVVALDATWGNARRMQGWFAKGTLTVRLPPESTLKENKLSLLRPVRRYRGDLESGRVSTVEAVASLLYELEGDEAMYRGLLDNLKIKVDACRLQKNLSLVYDTHAPEQPSERHRWRRERAREAGSGSGGEGGSGDSESETNAGEAEAGVPGA